MEISTFFLNGLQVFRSLVIFSQILVIEVSCPVKIPLSNLVFDSWGNMLDKYLKASPSLFSYITNCLIIPNLIGSGRIRTFSDSAKDWYFALCVFGNEGSLWCQYLLG